MDGLPDSCLRYVTWHVGRAGRILPLLAGMASPIYYLGLRYVGLCPAAARSILKLGCRLHQSPKCGCFSKRNHILNLEGIFLNKVVGNKG